MTLKGIKNSVSSNGFDMSSKRNYTSKGGEVTCMWWKHCIPGDVWNLELRNFTRTKPATAPSFLRSRKYIDFYFVPYNQLWNKFNTTITQMNENLQSASGPSILDNPNLSGYLPNFRLLDFIRYHTSLNASGNTQFKNNMFGYDRSTLAVKHLTDMRLGNIHLFNTLISASSGTSQFSELINTPLTLLPLLAYQKVYNDFFRESQWEKPNPSTFNVDYITGAGLTAQELNPIQKQYTAESNKLHKWVQTDTLFDLRYCNFQKDVFHGMLPQAQYGETSFVPLSTGNETSSAPAAVFTNAKDWKASTNPTPADGFSQTIKQNFIQFKDSSTSGAIEGSSKTLYNSLYTPGVLNSGTDKEFLFRFNGIISGLNGISILALRRAEAQQRWKEVSQANDQDYQDQIQAHFDQPVSDFLSGKCRHIGGIVQDLQLGEVVNTNLTGDFTADIQGKGTGSCQGTFKFQSGELYGCLMCISYELPIVDYITSGISPEWTSVQATDFPIPEFDRIGMETVPTLALTSFDGKDATRKAYNTFLGYAPRYIWWKTDYDYSSGDFQDTFLNWILSYSDDDVKAMLDAASSGTDSGNVSLGKTARYPFFKVNPAIYNSIFNVEADASWKTDVFLNQLFIKATVVRKLDRDGLPY